MTAREFWRWFEAEMARRGFRSVRQVERAGDVGNDTISGRQRRDLPPTDTVIRAIATAFGMSFEAVDSMATGERPEPRDSLTLRELWEIVSEMPVEDQRAVLDYALFRQSRSDEREEASQPRGRAASRESPAASESGG
ncbi:MAG: hypothetical protein ACP5HG_17185 [Anaerolineae bacterium]